MNAGTPPSRASRAALVATAAAILIVGCTTLPSTPFARDGGGTIGDPANAGGTGGAPAAGPHRAEVAEEELSPEQREVVETAGSLVGREKLRVNGRRFRFDCTGTILAAYYGAGIDLEREMKAYSGNGVTRLYKLSRDKRLLYEGERPRPGDVIFWDNTYDRDGDGQWNDRLTHAGVVIRTYEDGSVDYVHHNYREGIVVARMSLAAPDRHRDGEVLVNSPMRMKSHRSLRPSHWLASHLYRSAGMLYRL
ncbi:MAG: NlpC/P60 family protein [Spirochaetaceae bacterium]